MTYRTANLQSCILYIYSTNIGIEYFKHGIHSPFFPLQNTVCFISLNYLVPILFTFYIKSVLKLKKNNSGAKRLMTKTELPVPMLQQAGGLELQSEDFGEEKDLLSVPGIDPRYLTIPASNIVIVPTKLPWLLSSSK
jgi:hypothetical protein